MNYTHIPILHDVYMQPAVGGLELKVRHGVEEVNVRKTFTDGLVDFLVLVPLELGVD